ncbi:hypothetical protein AB0H34_18275 [Saccharopolyspora shandongensis]|uniref:hypothetical protein n=1 Tax=Saccharopolyspora shandongensis TaxID=418495 RepID=UPI0033ED80D2
MSFQDKLAAWLAEEVCPVELSDERLREAVLVRCRAEHIEPPGRLDRIVGSARSTFEQRFCQRTTERISEECVTALEGLVAEQDTARGLLADLKADPGQVGLETLLREIDKLTAVHRLGLPDGLFADASEKLVDAWRARAMRSYPSDLRAAPRPVRLTLLSALCWRRSSEITDALVELLIGLIYKINARADRRVERELTEDLRRVRGKEDILFRLAEATVDHPDELVRSALYPVVGEKTLQELVKEAKANEWAFQARAAEAGAHRVLTGPRHLLVAMVGLALRVWGRGRRSVRLRVAATDRWGVRPGHCDTGGQSGEPPSVRTFEHYCGQPGGESSHGSWRPYAVRSMSA